MAKSIISEVNDELTSLRSKINDFQSITLYLDNAKNVAKDSIDSIKNTDKSLQNRVDELKDTYEAFLLLEETVSELISKISDINFPDRLDNIETKVTDTIKHLDDTKKETLIELKSASETIISADFQGQFSKLNKEIEKSVNSSQKLADKIEDQKLPKKIDELEKGVTEHLKNSIEKLEKVTNKIAENVLKTVQDLNLPLRIDKLDTTISSILTGVQQVQNRIESLENNIKDKLIELQTKQVEELSSIKNLFFKKIKRQSILSGINLFLLLCVITLIIILNFWVQ